MAKQLEDLLLPFCHVRISAKKTPKCAIRSISSAASGGALLGTHWIQGTHRRDQEGLGWIGLGYLESEVLGHQLFVVVIMTVAQANPICGA